MLELVEPRRFPWIRTLVVLLLFVAWIASVVLGADPLTGLDATWAFMALFCSAPLATRAMRRGRGEAEAWNAATTSMAGWIAASLGASVRTLAAADAPLAIASDALAAAGVLLFGFAMGWLVRLAFLPIRPDARPTDSA